MKNNSCISWQGSCFMPLDTGTRDRHVGCRSPVSCLQIQEREIATGHCMNKLSAIDLT